MRSLDIYWRTWSCSGRIVITKKKPKFSFFYTSGLAFLANSQLIPENNVLYFCREKIDLEEVLCKSIESRESCTRLYLGTSLIVKGSISEQVSGRVIVHSLEKNNRSLCGLSIKLRFICATYYYSRDFFKFYGVCIAENTADRQIIMFQSR
jgi:hypothetical protein